jgi:Cys-tRNA(Pro) deacylase
MSKDKGPVTPAVRMLRQYNVRFTEHPYKYVDRGGTATFAKEYMVDEHAVIKTLVMEDDQERPFVVLMHGDREVSTKELARLMGVKRVEPCTPEQAQKNSGYMVGGTSPFGTRKDLPVYMEETILQCPRIFINGGRRGYLIGMDPGEIVRLLKPALVTVAI